MKILSFLNKTIEYSFYFLFFLVPLAFTNDTSELFEFNKLWVTFIITIVIGFAWIAKMIIKREFKIQKTPLDIPIGLFLISQIISSFISLDTHISFWGYYSRFNGGLFSILAYILLYFAFVTNLKEENKEKNTKQIEDNKKKILFFLGGALIFVIGALISSQIKNADNAGVPFQMIATLITVFASFVVFMQGAPQGKIRKSIYAIFSSAFLVLLWGLPSHFGYDPTCLLFRGSLDVACWTNDFQPKVRIFSTLGQPDWLAAYLAALIPLSGALFINSISKLKLSVKKIESLLDYNFLFSLSFFLLFILTYTALLFTKSRSAVLAVWLVLPLLLALYFWFYIKPKFTTKNITINFKSVILLLVSIVIVTFFAGQPFLQLERFTLSGIGKNFYKPVAVINTPKTTPTPAPPQAVGELGGTDSGVIRLLVWQGALDVWKNYPIFGSGLETFAFAYYKYRPAEHNLTSEWQYLYNKAHNEYLNYAATTGTLGIGTYLFMIGTFIAISLKYFLKKKNKHTNEDFLILSLVSGYATILITNFFGFSVVMINILFYLFPAFVLILNEKLDYNKTYGISFTEKHSTDLGIRRWALIGIIGVFALYLIFSLINFWNADRNYYYGSNYNQIGQYQKAYISLQNTLEKWPSEPTFQSEFAFNNVQLARAILSQNAQTSKQDQTQNLQFAKELMQNGVSLSEKVTLSHPNNIVFLKTKVRIYYALSEIDPNYLPLALTTITEASSLAPTDADISYNLGVLQGQNGNVNEAIKTLQKTIKLKPNFSKPYYALGIFYHALALDKNEKVVNQDYNQKAIAQMKYYISNFGEDEQASKAIETWSK